MYSRDASEDSIQLASTWFNMAATHKRFSTMMTMTKVNSLVLVMMTMTKDQSLIWTSAMEPNQSDFLSLSNAHKTHTLIFQSVFVCNIGLISHSRLSLFPSIESLSFTITKNVYLLAFVDIKMYTITSFVLRQLYRKNPLNDVVFIQKSMRQWFLYLHMQ